jgi:hypothetical protein
MARVVWNRVTRDDVVRALLEYDQLGSEGFFYAHGFGPTTTSGPLGRPGLHQPREGGSRR